MASRDPGLADILDPRRSIATALGWLVLVLALALGAMVGFSSGDLTRDALLEQRHERALNAVEQWASGLDAAIALRLQPLRTASAMVPSALRSSDTPRLAAVFADLQANYPELDWVGMADAEGRLLVSTPPQAGIEPTRQPWFRHGLTAPWTGLVTQRPDGTPSAAPHIGMAWPVHDAAGRAIGVVGAHLRLAWFRAAAAEVRLGVPMLNDGGVALLVDADGRVVIGPDARVGEPAPPERAGEVTAVAVQPRERLDALGWHVRLSWPIADATREADAARRRIVAVSLVLGAAVAVVGVLLARRLTRRLSALTHAVQALDPRTSDALAVPPGRDEASHLGRAFDGLLGALQRDRNALGKLSAELEQRVQARTREVERLADEARYAAVVRERLRIARDLHDTLAHSMMAMLMEVRVMRKLHAQNPAELPAELERAEQAARDGLAEARAAIAQMRFRGVRDLGLGAALDAALDAFRERTGLAVSYTAGPRAAGFADARAETVFRIAEEALRNIERHARASRVEATLADVGSAFIELTIRDDGIGFDATAAHPGHYGLVGLKEQAALAGAELTLSSAARAGTTLRLKLRSEPDLTA